MSKIKDRGLHMLFYMLLIVSLLLVTSAPALAEQATAADKLVQCDSAGNVTNHTAITGVNLPVVFDNNPDYYPISVDVAIYDGTTQVKELTGLAPDENGDLKIGLGANSNYTESIVYEIQYRAHYGIVGGGSEIAGDWQSAGLYFKAEVTPGVTNAAFTAATADGAIDTTTSTKIDITFDTSITGLTADDITITSGTGSATKGALTGSSTSWSIAISGVSEGTVNVAVGSPTGYSVSGSPKTVNVYAAPSPPPTVTLQSIAITTPATKLIYTVGDALDITGLVVTGTYSNNSKQAVPITKADVTGFNSSTANSSQTLTINYDDKTTTYTIAIQAAPTGRLTFSPPSGSNITASTPITITASPALSVTEAVYWNTSGSLPATDDFLYPAGGFNLSTPGTVYAAVYDASTLSWSDQASATYTAAVSATGVTLDKTTMSLTAGGATESLTATVAPANATNQNVTWTSSDPHIAAVANGIVTPIAAGTAKITATTADGSYTADCTVTVDPAAIPITGISVTGPGNATTVANGSTLQMSAAVLPADATDPSVTWSVAAGTGSATINSSTGLLTAAGEGTVTVKATANDGSGVSGTETITVTKAATNQEQSAPAGLAGVAPTTSANNDGRITGTTSAMEYKPASAADSAYTACTDTATTGLAAGIYDVRYAVKTGYNAGATTAVTVPAYVAVVAVTTASPNVNVSTTPLQITVPADVTDAALTLTSTPSVSGGNTTYTLPQVTTTASTSQGAVKVSIADGTTVTGLSSTFTGTINLPQVVSNPTVTVSGYTTAVSQAIELGSGNTALTFSQPVRILLAGQGGKLAGWIRNSSFTPITYQMASDSAAALGTNTDGYITIGSDLAIWTTHLTTFVAYTQTAISSGSGSGGGGSAVLTPAVQTESASAITADSAILNGDIISDNSYAVTGYGFLWGASSSNLSNKVAAGNNDLTGTFTTILSGLTAGTTYYYKAYATNKFGTVDGSIKSFATIEKAPVAAPIVNPAPTTTPAAATFSDVSASYWGYNAISSLVSKGIVSGYTDGRFKPDASITRAEFATMLAKALNLNTIGTTGRFTDVTADAWYYGTVNAAASKGLVSGMDNNRFAPDALVTREQMAVMAAKALGNKAPTTDGNELDAFKDQSAVSSWAVTGISEAVKAGIIGGMTTDKLAPIANATRVQAVEMIYKLLTVLSK